MTVSAVSIGAALTDPARGHHSERVRLAHVKIQDRQVERNGSKQYSHKFAVKP
jgi:hypothetical protein